MSTPSDPQVPRAVFYGSGPPRRRPPVSFLPGDHVVGGVAPVRIIAWRDVRAAIVLDTVSCFPNGFGFSVTARTREGFPARELPPMPRDDLSLPETVRVGVIFSDDRAVFSDVPGASDVPGMAVHPGGRGPVLTAQGSLGGPWRMDRHYFVSPLPPPGPVVFVFTWPLYAVDQVRTVVDGGELSAAAAQSITLWPGEPAE